VSACISAVQHLRNTGADRNRTFSGHGWCLVCHKIPKQSQHVRVLANEMLATRLGLALGCPCPRRNDCGIRTGSLSTQMIFE